ncbi:hypothetical protein ACIBG8_21190 [Nonomuraea sp. NPDC050556]|uniref:hypothetical protein n=1 Tax=Nonomuraea sp. NPDC050556 TaxID=3364369 RepID=UPI0037980BF3
MAVRLLGGPSGNQGSPTLYEDGDDILVQGYVLTPEEVAAIPFPAGRTLPEGEIITRIPKALLAFLPEESRGATRP